MSECRSCLSSNLDESIDLGLLFSSGHFPKSQFSQIPRGRLRLLQCRTCLLVQLDRDFQLSQLFGSSYGYRTSLNGSMKKHVESVATQALPYLKDLSRAKILDIGSNDGTLLNYFINQNDCLAIGVDPNINDMKSSYSNSIHTYSDFFDLNFATKLVNEFGADFNVITSIAMFYDVQNPNNFVEAIKYILAADGVWIVEISYLYSMLQSNSIDTVCHEHVTYYSLISMNHLLSRHGLKVVDFELNGANGGSMRLFVQRIDSSRAESKTFRYYLKQEERRPQIISQTLQSIMTDIRLNVDFFLSSIDWNTQIAQSNLLGLGASTKGNTFLQLFPEVASKISFIGEVNPDKFGSFTPGTLIPIKNQLELFNKYENSNWIVLPWHFRTDLIKRLRIYKNAISKLIFFLPELSYVEIP